ncbi:TetR/AcrR family transcriptional regulator [Cellulomonas sp. 73-145]|uniref:TetR/AcrR family transcriptional regulator n=1 Tax=Cellulomonas sp. 73-145 TaxID=1895739 RepID=UPI0025B9EC6E|nr:TetR/AcrR family transcriptional regulator [Cellulomonas sp. 73-145]
MTTWLTEGGWRHRPTEADEAQLLAAARDELRDRGYDGITLTAVAERAGTRGSRVHRRWWTRAELVVDALADPRPDPSTAPDTGSVVDDLRALRAGAHEEAFWRALPGLVAEAADSPELTSAIRDRLVQPRVEQLRAVLRRAAARGELGAADPDLLAEVPAAMVTYRLLVGREPLDPAFLEAVHEGLLVPAATGCAAH